MNLFVSLAHPYICSLIYLDACEDTFTASEQIRLICHNLEHFDSFNSLRPAFDLF